MDRPTNFYYKMGTYFYYKIGCLFYFFNYKTGTYFNYKMGSLLRTWYKKGIFFWSFFFLGGWFLFLGSLFYKIEYFLQKWSFTTKWALTNSPSLRDSGQVTSRVRRMGIWAKDLPKRHEINLRMKPDLPDDRRRDRLMAVYRIYRGNKFSLWHSSIHRPFIRFRF